MTPTQRELNLTALCTRLRARPFVWGLTDCAMLVALSLNAVGDRRLLDAWSGRWNSLASALLEQQAMPFREWLSDMGGDVVSPMSACTGDVLVLPATDGRGFDQAHVLVVDRVLSSAPALGVMLTPADPLLHAPGVECWRLI